MKGNNPRAMAAPAPARDETISSLLRELVAHLRQNRTELREERARRITEAEPLTANGRAQKS